ncbi:MAG: hypothetical protein GY861_20530 [bacterium]|nr:hypothetical protein [bacterium]
MKKLILLLALLIPSLLFAGPLQDKHKAVIAMMNVADGGGDCMSGTYMGAWDGDYTADTDKLCVNSGASNKDGTQSGGTLITGSFTVVTKDTYLRWTNTANDIIDEDEGTIWIEVNFDSGNDADIIFFEAYADGSNKLTLNYSDSGETVTFGRLGGGEGDSVVSGTVSKGSTVTIGATWSVGRGSSDFEITVNKGAAWTSDGVDGIATMTDITLMNLNNELSSTNAGQTITFTRLAVQAGWETACPW